MEIINVLSICGIILIAFYVGGEWVKHLLEEEKKAKGNGDE